MAEQIPLIDLAYDPRNSRESALKLVTSLFPEWAADSSTIQFISFKDGITNTLMKAVNRRPGMTDAQIDSDSVLLRAYGNGTHLLIDRDRECISHSLLAKHGLAPPLLARFSNGLLYRYIAGRVCGPEDLRRPTIFSAVAERIAEWHATLPIEAVISQPKKENKLVKANLPVPNIWTVMAQWTEALPTKTQEQKEQQISLQKEIQWLSGYLGKETGIDGRPLVYGHCDLLSANVIITASYSSSTNQSGHSPASSLASSPTTTSAPVSAGMFSRPGEREESEDQTVVQFIDYEYATPCPAAFDLSNHFAEWGGFECDPLALPSISQRRAFLTSYLGAYNRLQGREGSDKDVEALMAQVDLFRGVPGFYWGIWALVQAEISTIDFDYGNYATLRLSEYWAWKHSELGLVEADEDNLREKRWAEE